MLGVLETIIERKKMSAGKSRSSRRDVSVRCSGFGWADVGCSADPINHREKEKGRK